MQDDATIAALATPAAPAAWAIVRTSGPAAFALAEALGAGGLAASQATPVSLRLGDLTVPACCYAFAAPRSHTGEDVVEYHLPGNPLLASLLLAELERRGARRAQPGEFTARAFFNGRIRLDEAEGVAAAIAANSDRELAAARRLRAGELSARLEPSLEALADLLALCELGIDFAEEDVTVLESADAAERVEGLAAALRRLLEQAPRLERLAQPPRVALAGRPNAGKSTLLNALAGRRRAVASDVAGTTRDVLRADVDLPGGRMTLVDLAGLADAPPEGTIEAAAQERAAREAAMADGLVLVRETGDARPPIALPRSPDLVVASKADLSASSESAGGAAILRVSAVTGEGLDELRSRLGALAFTAAGGEAMALNGRHVRHVELAVAALEAARAALCAGEGGEIVALHLREALNELGGILGAVTPDEVLGRIFGRFCIGK